MARANALRSDFDGVELRRLARRSKDAGQARCLLALAAIYDGGTRSEAARLGNVTWTPPETLMSVGAPVGRRLAGASSA